MHKESHQYVNIVEAFGPFTKWNARVETGAIIPEVVRKAFKLAQEEKPGACHIELPEDVAEESADGEPLKVERARRPSPDRPSLARSAELLNKAQRPLILAGNGVLRGRASSELRVLAERAGIPVVNTFMVKGTMPADHPLAVMTVGLGQRDAERAPLRDAPGDKTFLEGTKRLPPGVFLHPVSSSRRTPLSANFHRKDKMLRNTGGPRPGKDGRGMPFAHQRPGRGPAVA